MISVNFIEMDLQIRIVCKGLSLFSKGSKVERFFFYKTFEICVFVHLLIRNWWYSIGKNLDFKVFLLLQDCFIWVQGVGFSLPILIWFLLLSLRSMCCFWSYGFLVIDLMACVIISIQDVWISGYIRFGLLWSDCLKDHSSSYC